jgi:hypothetical protein
MKFRQHHPNQRKIRFFLALPGALCLATTTVG